MGTETKSFNKMEKKDKESAFVVLDKVDYCNTSSVDIIATCKTLEKAKAVLREHIEDFLKYSLGVETDNLNDYFTDDDKTKWIYDGETLVVEMSVVESEVV